MPKSYSIILEWFVAVSIITQFPNVTLTFVQSFLGHMNYTWKKTVMFTKPYLVKSFLANQHLVSSLCCLRMRHRETKQSHMATKTERFCLPDLMLWKCFIMSKLNYFSVSAKDLDSRDLRTIGFYLQFSLFYRKALFWSLKLFAGSNIIRHL